MNVWCEVSVGGKRCEFEKEDFQIVVDLEVMVTECWAQLLKVGTVRCSKKALKPIHTFGNSLQTCRNYFAKKKELEEIGILYIFLQVDQDQSQVNVVATNTNS